MPVQILEQFLVKPQVNRDEMWQSGSSKHSCKLYVRGKLFSSLATGVNPNLGQIFYLDLERSHTRLFLSRHNPIKAKFQVNKQTLQLHHS